MQVNWRTTGRLAAFSLLLLAAGCMTEAEKKALNKPETEEPYSGFGASDKGPNKTPRDRVTDSPSDEEDPEKAVAILLDYLQRTDPRYYLLAESELRWWAAKQGVASLIVGQVRLLLKHPRIETRAPALRLLIAYGGWETAGDLIEVAGETDAERPATAGKHGRPAADAGRAGVRALPSCGRRDGRARRRTRAAAGRRPAAWRTSACR
jgi:hypothetical protein